MTVFQGSPNRLPAPAGLLIDRDQPVSFTFEGHGYHGYKGDTVASALAASGEWILSRSFKYHRPRGVLTMAGQDANTLVQLPGAPNVRADCLAIEPGMAVRGQHYTGSLEKDRDSWIGLIGRFLPVGFYYRAFYRPGKIWEKFWEPIVRAKSGLGRIDLEAHHDYFDKAYGFYDLVVVGGGPAGLSAAVVAARAGAEVLLVDENPVLGGALSYARFDVEGTAGQAKRQELIAAVEALPNIEVMTDAVCNGWFADNWLPVIRGNRLYKIRARELVLACGAIEQPALFRNNDLPGVMQASAAQRLIRLYGVRPGRQAVVLTGNAEGYATVLDLVEAGVNVVAVVDLRTEPDESPAAQAVARSGITVARGSCVSEALAERGNRHIRGVRVASLEAAGRAGGAGGGAGGEPLACDLLCMAVGYTPTYQLALQAGAKLDYDDTTALFSITNLPDHMALAGSMAGTYELEAVLAEGARAGWRAATALGLDAGAEPKVPAGEPTRVNHPWPIFPHPKGKDFVDFDEDLQVKDIVNAVKDGYRELELVKRFSTVGMGPSQGRHAALATARLVARETERTVAEIGVTTARPPFGPERLGVLAGRSFEPERLTAMHHRHLEAGAQMMPAGLWWRPAYYGAKGNREACMNEEARAVRGHLGMIDVSTLGGLEVRGPDAAEFLERMYTWAYAKQQIGRARYLLMTNDAGTVIDDGVACRFAEDHYYVTATTGGVDRVYQTMLWWNAQWRLAVDVANVTAAYAGVNIAGPASRDMLQPLTDDVDLSAEAFPYMGLREGTVAGIPARLIRVGFVGELGYEIHVPSAYGEALWDRLMEAGQAHDLKPFGVEAQRILRLEKGHIIIGQDS
ncbi:MAG: 2Fe-2S iron-sulfur cluster-binding protein, partial [Kiloniellales bacterium]|nr:2Fe-2S iron-sulfur cluster-binding protein [Kiloniellales bacterium]